MSKLFKFAQAKGKWHKFPSFNLGGGAKLYKNFAQKLLAVSLCAAMVLLGTPVTTFAAADPAHDTVALESTITMPYPHDIEKGIDVLSSYLPGSTIDVTVNWRFGTSSGYWLKFGGTTFTGTREGGVTCFHDVVVPSTDSDDVVFGQTVPFFGDETYFKGREFTPAAVLWDSSIDLTVGGTPHTLSLGDIKFCAHEGCRPTLEVTSGGSYVTVSGFDVSSGSWTVTPVAEGEAALKLSTGDETNWTGTVKVAAGSVSVTGVSLDKTALELAVGDDETLTATISPADATNKNVTWTSSNEAVASVSGDGLTGTVKALKAGTTTITVTTADGAKTATCVVTVTRPVTGVSLSETTKSLAVGESFNLTATISPEDATNKNVTWTSSDASIATVSGDGLTGTVQALKAGTTTITVTTADGAKTATCVVTVTAAAGTPPPATTPAAPPAATPADSSYLETTVNVKGQQQRLRVYDTNKILPAGTQLKAEAVTRHEHMDDDREIEQLLAYDLSLLDASGNPLHMPLDAPVELCFEVLDGLDKDELEVVLVQEFDDAEFEENLVDLNGASWVKVKTAHFSPYALIDKLSPEEKAALDRGNIQTGDLATQITVAGLGMTLVLALGIMLRLITSERKFEE